MWSGSNTTSGLQVGGSDATSYSTGGRNANCFCLWSCTVSDDQDPVADKKDLNFCLLHFKFRLNPLYHILAGYYGRHKAPIEL